ncbi:colicin release lysis protein [Escherichia coli]|nr:colicin release lysis protein [Escherichia coli]EIG6214922.1 colicin release lysis protein [Escherichia coli]
MKIVIFLITILFLSGCQANYIRDVQGGTVAPSWGSVGISAITPAKRFLPDGNHLFSVRSCS